jgi:hypothetical protein
MKFNNSFEKLPEKRMRCIAIAIVITEEGETAWRGIMDVYFSPEIGWRRCEQGHRNSIEVIAWVEHFLIEEIEIALNEMVVKNA